MEDHSLEELFQRAAEIAKAVPQPLREAAFNRAVDVLLGKHGPYASPEAGQGGEGGNGKRRTRLAPEPLVKSEENPAALLLTQMDRTKYSGIGDSPRVLDRSLALLRAARDDFRIDGLGPSAIAKVLTEKFRLRATKQAVQQALDAAGDKVDRVAPRSGKTYYRIMQPGEVYLDSPGNKLHGTTAEVKPSVPIKPRKGTPKTVKSSSARAGARRPGLKSMVLQLLQDGFFDKRRRIGEIRDQLRHKEGSIVKITTLSPCLVRLLRDKALDRSRADDGQYEYERKRSNT